jgi:hypothetical protein
MQARIKKTLICAGIETYQLNYTLPQYHLPRVGDVAVFEVLSLGKHLTIQSDARVMTKIMPGDRLMAAFGHRYATEQFEGYVPDQCQAEFHILGSGGTIGWVQSTHSKLAGVGPTRVRIVGYATDEAGEIINTKKRHQGAMLPFTGDAAALTRVVLSIGSSMDSGKTTTAAYLVHGLARQGRKVTFIKLTGTAFTKDRDLALDLGAQQSLDFSALGFPSTYLCEERELLDLYETLLRRAVDARPEVVVIEIADGIYQRETNLLLRNERFMNTVDRVIFSACDSLSALHGIDTLERWGIRPFALCGVMTTSPLLIREVQEHTTLPVYTLEQLMQAGVDTLMTEDEYEFAQGCD